MAPVMSRQDSRARAEEAFRLRAVGRTWAEIAVELGYGAPSAALMAVQRLHKRRPPQDGVTVRRTAAEGLRVLRSVLFEQFADARQRNDTEDMVAVAKEIRANIKEDADLHGAHAPKEFKVDATVKQSATAIIADARDRLLSVIDAEIVEPKELTR